MTYVYLVTSINYKNSTACKHIPTLGAHSSYKKAERHYKSVYAHRCSENDGLGVPGAGGCNPSAHLAGEGVPPGQGVLIMSDHFANEEIRLEKWRVK